MSAMKSEPSAKWEGAEKMSSISTCWEERPSERNSQ